MDISIITNVIFILGITTVILSCIASKKFCSYRKKLDGDSGSLSNAISLTLLGEAIIGLGTLVFAAAAHFGVLPSWSIGLQSGLRFVMFLATSSTTIHLMLVLRRIK